MRKKSNKPPETVSEQLRKHLEKCGTSSYRLERETGIHNSMLSRFLRGERGLSMKAIDDLCVYFGLRLTSTKKRPRGTAP